MEDVFAAFAVLVAAAGPLAIGVTKIVDALRNVFDPQGARFPKVTWIVAAFVASMAVCLGWQFNVVAGFFTLVPALANVTAVEGVAGQVLTGGLVAGMASYWHERMDVASSRAKAYAVGGDPKLR